MSAKEHPPSERQEKFQLLFTKGEIRRIDDWRFAQRARSRAEAIRLLIKKGLEASTDAQQPGA